MPKKILISCWTGIGGLLEEDGDARLLADVGGPPIDDPWQLMCTFTYGRLLHWGECDPAGIIFFPRYAEWMTEGLDMMMLGLAFDPNERLADGRVRGLPSVSCSAKFHAAPRLYEWVTHRVAVARVGTKSLTLSHRFSDDKKLFAEAEETRVFVIAGPDGMTAIEAPRELRAKLESDLAVAWSRQAARTSN